jgi:hypothetical protein
MHVARTTRNWLRSGPAVKRGFHFRAHDDIPLVVFASQVMQRVRRTVERQNRLFDKRPARPAISSHGPTVLTGGVPMYSAVKLCSAGGPAGSPCACGKTLSMTDEACRMWKLLLPLSPHSSGPQNMSDTRDLFTPMTVHVPCTRLCESFISLRSGKHFSAPCTIKALARALNHIKFAPEFIAQCAPLLAISWSICVKHLTSRLRLFGVVKCQFADFS